jgi:flagellar biosynthesis GTPase FlhF
MVPEASDGEQGKQVEMVPAAPDPEQQQATDVTAHQDYSEEDVAAAATAEINKLLSELQPLRAWISQLLGPAGPHRVVVTGDAGRRCLAFLETELSIFAAFLTPRQLDLIVLLLSNAGLCTDHVLHEVDPLRHTLLRRASRYLHCRNSSDVLHSTVWLYYINEECFRYRHLPTSSNLGLTPQLAEPEPGALPLVGIDRPTKKILRWLSQSQQGTMDRSQLRVMSIVGPVGIGKTTLAMELRNRIRQHETSGGHYYFQCNVMAQASRGADRNILLLQDILSQVSEPAAATALSSDPSSQAKTMKVLVRLVSKCLRDKRYQ